MKIKIIYFLFFTLSLLLILTVINQNAERIYDEEMEALRVSKLQLTTQKSYKRTRKSYVPERSSTLASQTIDTLLEKNPIAFKVNSSLFLDKSTLIKIVKIINHVKEEIVLKISAHTDTKGSSKHNLELSQKRADMLKEYFKRRTHLPLIVAIGYGEVFAFKNRVIEITLQRINSDTYNN